MATVIRARHLPPGGLATFNYFDRVAQVVEPLDHDDRGWIKVEIFTPSNGNQIYRWVSPDAQFAVPDEDD